MFDVGYFPPNTPPMVFPRTISLRRWRGCFGASKILKRFESRRVLEASKIESERKQCQDLDITCLNLR